MSESLLNLSAEIDFRSLEEFIKALKEMQRQARASAGDLDTLGSRADDAGDDIEDVADETDRFGESMGDLGGEIKGVDFILRALKNPLLAIGTALIGSTAAMIAGTQAASQQAVELRRMADGAGVSVEALQEFGAVTREIGVDIEGAADMLSDARVAFAEFSIEAAGPGALAMEALGISTTDARGNIREFSAVLPELIERIGRVSSAAERAALLDQIFAGDANKLSSFLANNAEGFNNLTRAARENGQVISEETNIKLEAAAKASASLARTMTASLTPAYAETSVSLAKFYEELEKLQPALTGGGGFIQDLTQLVIDSGTRTVELGVLVQKTAEDLSKDADTEGTKLSKLTGYVDDFTAALFRLRQGVRSSGDLVEGPVELIKGFTDAGNAFLPNGTAVQRAESIKPDTGVSITANLRSAAEIEKAAQAAEALNKSLTSQFRNNSVAILDTAVEKQELLIKIKADGYKNELANLRELGATQEDIDRTTLLSTQVLGQENTKLAALRKQQLESNYREEASRLRDLAEIRNALERGRVESVLAERDFNLDGKSPNASDIEKTKQLQLKLYNAERRIAADSLDLRLIDLGVFEEERRKIIGQFSKATQAGTTAIFKEARDETRAIAEQIKSDRDDLLDLFTQQENNALSGLYAVEDGANSNVSRRQERDAKLLRRQLQQEADALNERLALYEGYEEQKYKIREQFDRDAVAQMQLQTQKFKAENDQRIKDTLAPVTGFIEELVTGFALSGKAGADSWVEIRTAAIENLQQILVQQLANAAISQALSFGLSLFGGAAGAATGGVSASGGIPQGGGVTSFPTTTPQATPVFSGLASRSKPTGLQNDAPVTINMSIEGSNDTAAVEKAAQRGTEAGINNLIDKRILYQRRTGGSLSTRG